MSVLCVPNLSVPIPANGALTIAAASGMSVTVHVTDKEGLEVPGTLVMIADDMWGWHAVSPPVPGRYDLHISNESGFDELGEIEFVEATERAWPVLTSAASLSQVVANEAPACCTLDTGDGVIDFACTTLSETTYALLSPGLSSSSSAVDLNQYLFRYSAPDHGDYVAVLPWTAANELPIYEMSEHYCYEVAAIDLISGLVHPYDDLPERCVAHGALAPLKSTPTLLADDALASAVCPMPPAAFAERWCQLNAEACAVDMPPRHCHFYPFTCENQPYPGAGWRAPSTDPHGSLDALIELIDRTNEQTSDGGEAGDATLEGGLHEHADAGSPDMVADPLRSSDCSGCVVQRQRTQARLSELIFGFVAVCAWRALRRRVH